MELSKLPAEVLNSFTRHGTMNISMIMCLILAVCLLAADLHFYGVIGPLPCNPKNCSSTTPRPSVKLMMQDHMCHYFHHNGAELFEDYTRVSRLPFVTPNFITTIHILVGGLAGYLVSSENLKVRQLSVAVFQFRLFLDLLDGVVYRRQVNRPLYVSGWGTLGYYYDAAADMMASLFLLYGTYVLYMRHQPRRSEALPLTRLSDSQSPDAPIGRSVITSTLWLCFLQGLIRGACWDQYQRQFHTAFSKVLLNPVDSALQASIFNSPLTRFVLYLWKFSSAEGMLGFIYLSILLDFVWPMLVVIRKYGFIQLGIVIVITQLHSWQVYELLSKTK